MLINAVAYGSLETKKKCILKAKNETISFILDAGVPVGSIDLDLPLATNSEWIVIYTTNTAANAAEGPQRWFSISGTMPKSEEVGWRINPVDAWNAFSINTHNTQSPVSINVSFAFFPSYLKDYCPLRKAQSCRIELLDDISSADLIQHPEWRSIILNALRELPPAVRSYEDSFWLSLNAALNGINLCIPIRLMPTSTHGKSSFDGDERVFLFDFGQEEAMDIYIYSHLHPSPLPPAPTNLIMSDIGLPNELIVNQIQETIDDCFLLAERLLLFGIYGEAEAYMKECVLKKTCLNRGIPIKRLFPSTNVAAESDTTIAFIFHCDSVTKVSYEFVKSLLTSKSLSNAIVFVLIKGSAPDPLTVDKRSPIYLMRCLFDDAFTCSPSANILENLSESPLKRQAWKSNGKKKEQVIKVRWEDVAGLDDAKAILKETLKASPSDLDPSLRQFARRCGILFHGPPGTGKTLLAKAVATEFNMNFISVKGPELLDIYVGESEAHLREVFIQARQSAPSIIFFDELDSLAVMRGRDGDGGGVTDRLVSQLLHEMDSLAQEEEEDRLVFVIGATNRPDLLDPALLRPGRFDKLIHLALPSTSEEQAAILQATCRKYLLSVDVDFLHLSTTLLPKTLSPAELASIGHDAMRIALSKAIASLESSRASCSLDSDLDLTVVIDSDDLIEAITRHLEQPQSNK